MVIVIALGAALAITGVGMLIGKIGGIWVDHENSILKVLGIVLIGLGAGIGAIAIPAVLQSVPDPDRQLPALGRADADSNWQQAGRVPTCPSARLSED